MFDNVFNKEDYCRQYGLNLYNNCLTRIMKEVIEKKRIKEISMGTAIAMSAIEKSRDDRDESRARTKLSRILFDCGLKSPWRKHFYEAYDLMATYMYILGKDSITKEELFDVSSDMDIYNMYFRDKCEEYASLDLDMPMINVNGYVSRDDLECDLDRQRPYSIQKQKDKIYHGLAKLPFCEIDEIKSVSHESVSM
ncbi:MAG: hypothetical protein E7356_04885 [Clostridiales bacterium]|nr:hypothetical protein [Clostridiales bacterium]